MKPRGVCVIYCSLPKAIISVPEKAWNIQSSKMYTKKYFLYAKALDYSVYLD